MKSFIVMQILYCCVLSYPQTFHSLDGIESQQGETILLYRKGVEYFYYNPVYKFNTSTLTEQFTMDAFYYYTIGQARGIWDFEFFPAEENNFMDVGGEINPDNHSWIARNDTNVYGGFGNFFAVDISKQNPMKVFAFDGSTFRSFDGGYTFPTDSVLIPSSYIAVSAADFDDNTFFGFDEDKNFVKNGGLADTSKIFFDRHFKMLYDNNLLHVYRVNKTYGAYTFNVSNNKGNAFTWSASYYSNTPLYMTIDPLISGEVYLADRNIIYRSINYGNDFIHYKTLPNQINGIYKKPGSNTIYASTSYKIFEVTPDTTFIIKYLPAPPGVFEWFPLDIGNRWVYTITEYDHTCFFVVKTYNSSFTITKDTVFNDKTYFKFEPPLLWLYDYIRIDTADARLYALDWTLQEFPIYDFLMEPGDTVFFPQIYGNPMGYFLEMEYTFELFNELRTGRYLEGFGFLDSRSYSLARGFGIFAHQICEFGGSSSYLKGSLLNGIVYGDTTLSNVNDFKTSPAAFELHQNYPNPFNPVTTIAFSLPLSSKAVIKIFDILGNEIETLVDEVMPAGKNEVIWNAVDLPSGVYYYRLQSGVYTETRKMILMR